MRTRYRDWADRVLARLLPRVVGWLSSTLRVEVAGPEPDPRVSHVYAFLHGRQLPLLRYPRRGCVAVLTSLSADGELQARVLSALGLAVVRGSSSRVGAECLIALVRAVRGGTSVALAVDGPRGPRGEAKPGVLHVARLGGGVVVPVTSAARPALTLETWDRFLLPLPWARVVLLRGEPFEVARGAGPSALEASRLELGRTLAALSHRAEDAVRGPRSACRARSSGG